MGLICVSLFTCYFAEEFCDQLKAALRGFRSCFALYRLCLHFFKEMDPVGERGRVGGFHATGDVSMEVFFLRGEFVAWDAEELTDDCQLFIVGKAGWVIGGSVVDIFASADPHRIRVFPDGAEEAVEPDNVRVFRWLVVMEVL